MSSPTICDGGRDSNVSKAELTVNEVGLDWSEVEKGKEEVVKDGEFAHFKIPKK